MASLAGVCAGAWLHQTRSEPRYYMSDQDMAIALSFRLGLRPARVAQLARCRLSSCKCETPPFDHAMVCPGIVGGEGTVRHNFVLNDLCTTARRAGCGVWEEPAIVGPGDRRDARTQRGTRPDAIITFIHGRIMIDVSIIHTTSPSYLERKQPASAADREHEKREWMEWVAHRDGCTFEPFVMESYGTFGARAFKLLRKIANHSSQDTNLRNSFYRDAVASLSIALQRGNANMIAHHAWRSQAKLAEAARATRHNLLPQPQPQLQPQPRLQPPSIPILGRPPLLQPPIRPVRSAAAALAFLSSGDDMDDHSPVGTDDDLSESDDPIRDSLSSRRAAPVLPPPHLGAAGIHPPGPGVANLARRGSAPPPAR